MRPLIVITFVRRGNKGNSSNLFDLPLLAVVMFYLV